MKPPISPQSKQNKLQKREEVGHRTFRKPLVAALIYMNGKGTFIPYSCCESILS